MRRGAHLPLLAGHNDVGVRACAIRPLSLAKVARLKIERRRDSAELTVERITGELTDDALNNAFEVVVKELCARGICY